MHCACPRAPRRISPLTSSHGDSRSRLTSTIALRSRRGLRRGRSRCGGRSGATAELGLVRLEGGDLVHDALRGACLAVLHGRGVLQAPALDRVLQLCHRCFGLGRGLRLAILCWLQVVGLGVRLIKLLPESLDVRVGPRVLSSSPFSASGTTILSMMRCAATALPCSMSRRASCASSQSNVPASPAELDGSREPAAAGRLSAADPLVPPS